MLFIPSPALLAQVDAVVVNMDLPLNLRAAPNIESSILDQLPAGTALHILGRSADSAWLEVETDRYSIGWVYSEYVTVYINLTAVRVRDGVGTALDYGAIVLGDVTNARRIVQQGQQRGNRLDVFSKVGDSITVSAHMLHPFAHSPYNLADYAYLQPTLDYFSQTLARDGNAFDNTSLAAGVGWSAAAVLDPKFADTEYCLPHESPLVCEYRVVRPALALIMFGTNDVGFREVNAYRADLHRIVETSINMGVLPVLSTIPQRIGFEEKVAVFNQAVRDTAQTYGIPLWDYARIMALVGPYGLGEDGVHPSVPPNGYDGAVDFRSGNLYYGYVLRNLSALHVLDRLWHEVIAPPSPAAGAHVQPSATPSEQREYDRRAA